MFRAILVVTATLTACAVPPPTATTTSTPASTLGSGAGETNAQETFLENADPHDVAMLLAHGVRNRLGTGDLATWLPHHAVFPFDLDGKTTVSDSGALREALATRVNEWAEQTSGQSRCDAVGRADIMSGHKSFHYLDRLGDRPPSAALARDLDRLGVEPNDILVNCYTPYTSQAGYTVIATPVGHTLRLKSFRN